MFYIKPQLLRHLDFVSPVPVVEILQESPGNRQRRRTTESKQEERAPEKQSQDDGGVEV
jgi:hypothetical protein